MINELKAYAWIILFIVAAPLVLAVSAAAFVLSAGAALAVFRWAVGIAFGA